MAIYFNDSEREGAAEECRLCGGQGAVRVKFFDLGGPEAAVKFLTYTFPPGANEGVHTHAFAAARSAPTSRGEMRTAIAPLRDPARCGQATCRR